MTRISVGHLLCLLSVVTDVPEAVHKGIVASNLIKLSLIVDTEFVYERSILAKSLSIYQLKYST